MAEKFSSIMYFDTEEEKEAFEKNMQTASTALVEEKRALAEVKPVVHKKHKKNHKRR